MSNIEEPGVTVNRVVGTIPPSNARGGATAHVGNGGGGGGSGGTPGECNPRWSSVRLVAHAVHAFVQHRAVSWIVYDKGVRVADRNVLAGSEGKSVGELDRR
jgi:hypothetical protein